MNNSTVGKVRKAGLGILDVVLIIFIVLKLAGVGPIAYWSWWWVISPLWIGVLLLGVLTLLVLWVSRLADSK